MVLVTLKIFLVQKLLYYQTTAKIAQKFNQPSMVLNCLGAKAIKLSFFPILMKFFQK